MLVLCTGLLVPVIVPTANEDREGNKQIEAGKLPVPQSTVLLLSSDPRTPSMFKVILKSGFWPLYL